MAESNVSKTLQRIKQSTTGAVDAQVASRTEGLAGMKDAVAAAQKKSVSRHSKRMRRDGRRELSAAQSALSAEQKAIQGLTSTDEYKRNADLAKGAEFGASVLGEEGLGRLGTDTEIQETLGRFKDISEQGLSRQELAAERAQATRSIDSATQTGMRGLQAKLARMGVKGAVAGQQLIGREMAGAQQKADLAQNLFLKSEQVKREGLKDFSSRLGEVKTFDLGQAAKEKDIMVQSGLGFAQMGSSERTAKFAAEQSAKASVASAKASKPSCFTGDNKLELGNGLLINFADLEPGMMLKDDNLVLGVSKHLALDTLYDYNGVKVTGDHFVWEQGFFKPVKESEIAKEVKYPVGTLYVWNIITDSGIIEINGNVFSDWEDDRIKEDYEKIRTLLKGKVQSKIGGER